MAIDAASMMTERQVALGAYPHVLAGRVGGFVPSVFLLFLFLQAHMFFSFLIVELCHGSNHPD